MLFPWKLFTLSMVNAMFAYVALFLGLVRGAYWPGAGSFLVVGFCFAMLAAVAGMAADEVVDKDRAFRYGASLTGLLLISAIIQYVRELKKLLGG